MKLSLEEEKKYELKTFNSENARRIGEYAILYAKEHQLDICIDIYAYSKQLFHYCGDRCTPSNERFIKKKRNSVLFFGHSTKFLYRKNNGNQEVLSQKYGLNTTDYTLTPGGFPIKLKDSGIVGTICVSGLEPEEDHKLVLMLMEWYKTNLVK